MKLTNLTRNNVISTNLKEARSTMDRLLGLHKKSNPRSLLFKTRFGIHTLLLKTPIDVIVLNSKNIVQIAKTIKPNRILIYKPTLKTAIELPPGTIASSHTKPGDKLKIKSK